MLTIRFSLHDDDPRFAPVRAHDADACFDLFARDFSRPDALGEAAEATALAPGTRCLARTGVFLEMEPGWEALVRPRSGNALKLGLTVLNAPGTIDAGYRNEVGVILHNAGRAPIDLCAGMRIAQIAFRPIPDHALEPISRAEFDAGTARGLGGFGSSGVKEMPGQ
ncbi:MAG: dUTP diphosphatase [Planctomycetota bacterium]|jgi:dUTP pyrophosphatase|nr:dUTP diphosphatase [Planctomycetota bacterium]